MPEEHKSSQRNSITHIIQWIRTELVHYFQFHVFNCGSNHVGISHGQIMPIHRISCSCKKLYIVMYRTSTQYPVLCGIYFICGLFCKVSSVLRHEEIFSFMVFRSLSHGFTVFSEYNISADKATIDWFVKQLICKSQSLITADSSFVILCLVVFYSFISPVLRHTEIGKFTMLLAGLANTCSGFTSI